MTRERVQSLVVGLVVVVFVASSLGYLLVPSAMLSIVGIEGNRQVDFWSEPSPPPCWPCPRGLDCAAQGRDVVPARRLDRARGLPVRQFAG